MRNAGAIAAIAVMSCISIPPFVPPQPSDGGGLETSQGSDGGITVTGPHYAVHFAATGGHFPDSMTIDGGSNLIATAPACDDESGFGDALVPAFNTAAVTGSSQIVLAGSAIVEVEVDWSVPTGCAAGNATSNLAGATRFTFLPDGHLTRYDGFQLTGADIADSNPSCACGNAPHRPLALTAYQTYGGTAKNVSDEDGTIGGDVALAVGSGLDTDSDLCLVDDSGTPQIVFGFPFPDSSWMRMGRHRVHIPRAGAVSLVLDYLDPDADGTTVALPPEGSNYSDSVIAVDMYLMPAGTPGTCASELNDIYMQRAVGMQIATTGTDQPSYQAADKDHVFGGEESEGHFAPIAAEAGTPVTIALHDGSKIAVGVGVLLTFDTAPVEGSVAVRRSSDKPVIFQKQTDHVYQFFFGGGFAGDDVVTITSTAP